MASSRLFNPSMNDVNQLDKLYQDICDGTKKNITQADIYKILADKLSITVESLSTSEVLENKILRFILSLSSDCCKSLPRDIDMTDRAQWKIVNRRSFGGAAIEITYGQFTLQQADELVDTINKNYSGVAMVPHYELPKRELVNDDERERLDLLHMRFDNQVIGTFGKDHVVAIPTISLSVVKFFKDVLPHIPVARPSYGLGF